MQRTYSSKKGPQDASSNQEGTHEGRECVRGGKHKVRNHATSSARKQRMLPIIVLKFAGARHDIQLVPVCRARHRMFSTLDSRRRRRG